MTFTDTGKRPVLFFLGVAGTSGLLAGGGKPLPGWCSISTETGKLVFYLEGLGRKEIDLRTAELVNMPGRLISDSGQFNLQAYSTPFENNGSVCVFVTHFRGKLPGSQADDPIRDLFVLGTPFAVNPVAPQPQPAPVPAPSPTPAPAPVEPPAPPSATVDLSAVLQAITSTHDGVDATFNLVKSEAAAIINALPLEGLRDFRTPASEDDGLPPELVANLSTQWQRDLAFVLITVAETLCRLDEFPRKDGGTILRV